ncbi:MAG: protease [Crenarchaeota archaeon]|nr:protease [Thermoproteota archaeon]MDW8034022.1 hypothetical protein [Nitrososphaerota archaeon]
MRIKGFLERKFDPPAPFVKAILVSDELNVSRLIDFHVDTGASASIILDKDLRYLKLDITKLKKAERNVGGIGGMIDTYVIEDAKLMFRTDEGSLHGERLKMLVARHDLTGLDAESIRLVLTMPSLLGRDILRRYKLIYSERSNEVILEL